MSVRFQRLLRPSVLLAVAAATVLFPSGCSEKSGAAGGPGGGRGRGGGPAPVIVGKVEQRVVPLILDAIGTIEPIRSADVRAQITGTLFKINAQEGQDVAQGDLLLEIDPRPFQNALRSAEADQQRIAVQLDTARRQLSRYKALDVGAMISQEQFQQFEDNARTLEAQAAAAEAAVATARLQLSYCSIRAPIAGRLGDFTVHEGDMIRGNDNEPLVTIVQVRPIYATFSIAQQHLAALARYRAEGTLMVDVAGTAGEPPVDRGELTFLDNTVDPATGTIKLKATLPNAEMKLWPGQFITASLTLASPEVLAVPTSAIQTDQTGQHVFVVKPDNTAEFRRVTVERTAEPYAVIKDGLKTGETVVIDGQLRVMPGGPVQIRPADVLVNPERHLAAPKGGGGKAPGEGKGEPKAKKDPS